MSKVPLTTPKETMIGEMKEVKNNELDFAVIGTGIQGLMAVLQLLETTPPEKIVLVDKPNHL